MYTNIAETVAVEGSGKGAAGWFRLGRAVVSYDHPFHADVEHALNIDFTAGADAAAPRVAVELSLESARELARVLAAALEQAEAYERG